MKRKKGEKIIFCQACINQKKARPGNIQEKSLKACQLKNLNCQACQEKIQDRFFILARKGIAFAQ